MCSLSTNTQLELIKSDWGEIMEKYEKSVAYFSMEIAIDQCLKTYSGGLGYLAGSHMRSAYELNQNLVGVSMLWKYGYYTQHRSENFHMDVKYIQKFYSFLEDTGIVVDVNIHDHICKVRAYYLPPETFNTVGIYFLTTDIEENDFLSRTISHHLYDPNLATRIAQEMVLGIGGAKVLEQVGEPDIYHMNEAHPLPLAFYLYEKYNDLEKVRKHLVFTTHTPEKAGNPSYDFKALKEMKYFGDCDLNKIAKITGSDQFVETTAVALTFSKKANAVSKMHAKVAREMWQHIAAPEKIIGITNAQNRRYWQDKLLAKALVDNNDQALIDRKKKLKRKLFKIVANQEGDLFDDNILTIVWARRFAGYKRPDLILRKLHEFLDMISSCDYPVQMIWAGKPYPKDQEGIAIFNSLVDLCYTRQSCSVLVGYELALSKRLKTGADIWLNTPRITREASGTSGMTAAMNGAINFSIPDGWIPEFARDGENCFLIPSDVNDANTAEQDEKDYQSMMKVLKETIIPMYYNDQKQWLKIVKNSMRDVMAFESGRMADEYYKLLYNVR